MKTKTAIPMALLAGAFSVTPLGANQDQNNARSPAPKQADRPAGYAQDQMPRNQREFIQGALSANTTLIKEGQLALQRGRHPATREFGQTLVQDHTRIQEKLRALARKHQAQGGEGAAQKENHPTRYYEDLAALSIAQFDQTILAHLADHHRRDLQRMEQAKQKFGGDSEIDSFIQQHTPMVRRHLEMAEAALKNVQAAQRDQDSTVSRTARNDARDNDGIDFKAGDGEILGLPTSNNDGTIAGIIPAPSATVATDQDRSYVAEELTDGRVDEEVDTVFEADRNAVGAPPTQQRERRASAFVNANELPQAARQALERKGWQGKNRLQQVTLYQAEVDGRSVYVTPRGEVLEPAQPQQ